MRLADRLFAFRRLPAWGDAVQVLLWILGWAVIVGFLVSMADTLRTSAAVAGARGSSFMVMAIVLFLGSTLVWLLGACWFVSEAYGGWRSGHRHGKQWTLVIASILLMGVFGLAMALRTDMRPFHLALFAAEVAFGLGLLIACLTTAQPLPPSPPTTPAPALAGP
jgi:hypothetical protein